MRKKICLFVLLTLFCTSCSTPPAENVALGSAASQHAEADLEQTLREKELLIEQEQQAKEKTALEEQAARQAEEAQRAMKASSITKPSKEQMPNPSHIERVLPKAPEPQEGMPDPGVILTEELGQEIYDRWIIAMEQGMDKPGALGEFLAEHPDFLYNQAGRINAEAGEDVSQAWLVLYQNVRPDEDMIHRERLARFAQNIKEGIPDCIVMILSAAPLDPVPLWVSVLTYDGSENTYRKDNYNTAFRKTSTGTLTETEIEWILTDSGGVTQYIPKYGYEPIPFSEIFGACKTKDEILEAVVEFFTESAPSDAPLSPVEVTEQDSSTLDFSYLSPERQEGFYIWDLLCTIQTDDRGYQYSGSYAVAKDMSSFYLIEQMGGNWLLRARPRPAPEQEMCIA